MRNLTISMLFLIVLVAIAVFLYAFLSSLPPPADPLVPTVPPRRWPWASADGTAAAVAATRLARLNAAPTDTAAPIPSCKVQGTRCKVQDASPTAAATPKPSPSATASPVPSASPMPPATTVAPANAPIPSPSATASAVPSASPMPPAATFVPPTAAAPTITPTVSGTFYPAPSPSWGLPTSLRGRIGVGVPLKGIGSFAWGDATPGWYLNWTTQPADDGLKGVVFARMIRLKGSDFSPGLERIQATAAAAPGSLWLIGNEPDVPWQDNATPEQYAATYGVLYRAIKQADPTAHVAIGGISQPTPLRLAYLDRILAAYRAQYAADMPVDVWNIHAFILREERNSWGVGIPPGMAVDRGTLYEIDHHADLAIFREQIVAFRRWMAGHDQRDKPLIVTEYGILMPEDYGFPPELVGKFMAATFDYFLNARDETLGYAADDYRLVQAFCWYSVADTVYPTSNLFDAQTGAITSVGRAFQQYVRSLP